MTESNPYKKKETTSLTLLRRVKSNDDQIAWRWFVELYTPLMHFWAKNVGMKDAEASDVVQDVFVTLAQKIREFEYDRKGTFRGWLRLVTRRHAINYLRKKRPDLAESGELRSVSVDNNVDEISNVEYKNYLIRRALEIMKAEFDDKKWQAVWWTYIEGRSTQEVASELDVTENWIYVNRGRVLRRIREEMYGMWDDS